MGEKLRIGVIGAGWWAADYHIPGLLAETEVELAGVCDPHQGRLTETAQAYGLTRLYPDYQTLLECEPVDGVMVVTPHATHYAIARDCLERGLHLFVEKPLTLVAREARDLVERAAARGRVLMTGYANHHFRHIQQARAAIAARQIGEVQYVNSSFSSDIFGFLGGQVGPGKAPAAFRIHGPSEAYNDPALLGGGEGHLQLTHSIGLMLYVSGLRPARVQAVMKQHGRHSDLVDAISLEFAGGALGVVGGTGNAGANHRMSLAVYASAGCYVYDSMGRFAVLRDYAGQALPLDFDAALPYRYSTTRNFVNTILGREENHASGEVAWRAVELLEAAYRSAAQNGRPVDVEELYR